MLKSFGTFINGTFIKNKREKLQKEDSRYSQRQVALRIKVEPSYLSQVERGNQAPPSEAKIIALAKELNEDPDVLLAMAGKVSSDLQKVIRKRPELFAQLIVKGRVNSYQCGGVKVYHSG